MSISVWEKLQRRVGLDVSVRAPVFGAEKKRTAGNKAQGLRLQPSPIVHGVYAAPAMPRHTPQQ